MFESTVGLSQVPAEAELESVYNFSCGTLPQKLGQLHVCYEYVGWWIVTWTTAGLPYGCVPRLA